LFEAIADLFSILSGGTIGGSGFGDGGGDGTPCGNVQCVGGIIAGVAIWYYDEETGQWHRVTPGAGGTTIDINAGSNGPPGTTSGPGGGQGAGTAQDAGQSGQGPSGGGATTTASASNPSGGSVWDECGNTCGAALGRAANFSAGAGDAMTLGLTRFARKGTSWIAGKLGSTNLSGYGENVNYRSGAYWGGAATGTAIAAVLTPYLAGPKSPLAGSLINQNRYVRLGWGRMGGTNTFRLAIGGSADTAHLDFIGKTAGRAVLDFFSQLF
jgi:hypothetical protein